MIPSHIVRQDLGRRLALVLVLGCLVSCVASGAADKRLLQHLNQEGFGKRYSGNSQEQNYVTIGDMIQYVDSYNDDIRGASTVEIDGTIQIPQVGSVFVAGMTRSELESFLTQKLSPYFTRTDVQVTLKAGGQRAYYVWGEVNGRGRQKFEGDLTVFEAVLRARPNDHTANLGRVKLIRADPHDPLIIDVNVADWWKRGDSTYNVNVQEYDIIYVPPTVLKQLSDVVSAIIVPIVSPLRTVLQTLFFIENPNVFGNRNFRV